MTTDTPVTLRIPQSLAEQLHAAIIAGARESQNANEPAQNVGIPTIAQSDTRPIAFLGQQDESTIPADEAEEIRRQFTHTGRMTGGDFVMELERIARDIERIRQAASVVALAGKGMRSDEGKDIAEMVGWQIDAELWKVLRRLSVAAYDCDELRG